MFPCCGCNRNHSLSFRQNRVRTVPIYFDLYLYILYNIVHWITVHAITLFITISNLFWTVDQTVCKNGTMPCKKLKRMVMNHSIPSLELSVKWVWNPLGTSLNYQKTTMETANAYVDAMWKLPWNDVKNQKLWFHVIC